MRCPRPACAPPPARPSLSLTVRDPVLRPSDYPQRGRESLRSALPAAAAPAATCRRNVPPQRANERARALELEGGVVPAIQPRQRAEHVQARLRDGRASSADPDGMPSRRKAFSRTQAASIFCTSAATTGPWTLRPGSIPDWPVAVGGNSGTSGGRPGSGCHGTEPSRPPHDPNAASQSAWSPNPDCVMRTRTRPPPTSRISYVMTTGPGPAASLAPLGHRTRRAATRHVPPGSRAG